MPTLHPNAVTSVGAAKQPSLELGDVHDIVRRHPAFTESSVRSLIARAQRNGLHRHLYRIGRRVLIDLQGFESWVREKQSSQNA
jgi:hypothetical protein